MAKIPTYPGIRTYPGWSEGEASSNSGGIVGEPSSGAPFTQIGPVDPVAIRVGGLTLGCRDSDGGQWWVTQVDQLHDLRVRFEKVTRQMGDGTITGDGLLDPRHAEISVSIGIKPESNASLHDRLDALKRSLPIRRTAPVVVRDWGRVFCVDARVEDTVKVKRVGKWRFDVAIPLYIPDPVLLAASWQTGQPAWVTRSLSMQTVMSGFTVPFTLPVNIPSSSRDDGLSRFTVAGSGPARMVMTLTGPVENPVITDAAGGWQTTLTGTLGAGETLSIDPHLRQVLAGGISSRRAWLSGWPSLEPGEHAISWTGEGASVETMLRVDYVETYL